MVLEKRRVFPVVLYFDFNGMDYSQPDSLSKKLDVILADYEKIYGKNETDGGNITLRFASLIKNAHDKINLSEWKIC